MSDLSSLGWNPSWAARFEPYAEAGFFSGRVCVEHRELYHVDSERGTVKAEVSGRLRYTAAGRADFPAVGDWVALEPAADDHAIIHAVLERDSKFSRKLAGRVTDEQIIAANLTTLFLVTSLNRDLNPRRIERYLAALPGRQIQPVLLLNKSDLCDRPDDAVARMRARVPGLPVHALSAHTGQGLDALADYLGPGQTVSLVGSSGVGKSTLVNRLLGANWQEVQAIRADDDRGRHTTTHREMVRLPQGGLLIDNPGMRELQLWDEGADVDGAFTDVAGLAAQCFFPDCTHEHEPRCAVKQAVADGVLDPARLESYRKLQRELAYQETRHDPQAERARKEEWKRIHRAVNKEKRRRDS